MGEITNKMMNFFSIENKRKKDGVKKSYWNILPILKTDADWLCCNGERSNGKSYSWKLHLLKCAWKDNEKPEEERNGRFLYLRRYSDDVTNTMVEGYFSDMVCNKDGKHEIADMTGNKYNNIRAKSGKIWLVKYDEDGEEDKDAIPYLVGRYTNLGNAERIKSQAFVGFDWICLEEYLASSKPYLPDEASLLVSIVSTVCRDHKVKVVLIGNTERRISPYMEYFGWSHITQQEPGTIDVYDVDTGEIDEFGNKIVVRCAVEICEESGMNKNGMFYGNAVRNVGVQWDSKLQPRLTGKELEKYENIYEVFFLWHSLKFRACLYIGDDGSMFWNVLPFTKEITDDTARVISNEVRPNPFWTCNMTPKNKLEAVAFQLLDEGKAFFATSLCGTEFKQAYSEFKNATLATM